MAATSSYALLRALMGNGQNSFNMMPQAVRLGAITQAPAAGGMSGGAQAPSLGSVPSPQFVNPSGDPMLSKNTPNSLLNRAEKDVADRFDDYMNNQWLPQGPTRTAQNQMYQQGYGTQEKPGPLMGAMPQGMGQIGANLAAQNANPAVQDQALNLGMALKQAENTQKNKEEELLYHKMQAEAAMKNAESNAMLRAANAAKANRSGGGGGGGKKSAAAAAAPITDTPIQGYGILRGRR